MAFELEKLPYAFDALEPHIDARTMEIHHDKHHAGYVKGLNATNEKILEAIKAQKYGTIKHLEKDLAFHGAGHFLHTLYWNNMGTEKGKRSAKLKNFINKSFGSFENFKPYFKAATKSVEGSGWGILAYEPYAKKLVILQAEKHQNLSLWMNIPLLVCDVWEHAYYIDYRNARAKYIEGFWNLVNWDFVTANLK